MSAKLVAEYGVADHLVVYSEGRMSVWRRDVDVRPARKRIVDVVELPRCRVGERVAPAVRELSKDEVMAMPAKERAAWLRAKYAQRR